jgi:hypothetical protein
LYPFKCKFVVLLRRLKQEVKINLCHTNFQRAELYHLCKLSLSPTQPLEDGALCSTKTSSGVSTHVEGVSANKQFGLRFVCTITWTCKLYDQLNCIDFVCKYVQQHPWTLEFAYEVIARQPIIEKSGPYCVIGVGPLKNQTSPSH